MRNRFSRRAIALGIITVIISRLAITYLMRPAPASAAERTPVLRWLPDWVTSHTVGASLTVLAAVAALVVIVSLVSDWMRRPISKHVLAVGFSAAMLAAFLLAFIYVGAEIFSLTNSGGWLVYVAYGTLILLIGGWDEPSETLPLTGSQRAILTGEPDGH